MKKLLLTLAAGLFGITQPLNAAESAGIEGNYKLVSHKSADGKVIKAPHLAGMINLTPGGYKNLNVMYRGVTSKSQSISSPGISCQAPHTRRHSSRRPTIRSRARFLLLQASPGARK